MASREAIAAIRSISDFKFLVNFIATTVEVDDFSDKIELLQYDDIRARAMKLLSLLNMEIELSKIKQDINQKVKSEIDQQQREYYLNNQLKTIQEELGMDEGEDYDKLKERAAKKKWSKETGEAFEKELNRLQKYSPNSPDYSVQYNYLDFMLNLPWDEMSEDNLDLSHAQKVLDEDHYGLAILLDDDYYAFLRQGRIQLAGVTVLDAPYLIPFKAKAWLDLSARKAAGEAIDSKNIRKHKNDVFRLAELLTPLPDPSLQIPPAVRADMQRFLEQMESEFVDLKQLSVLRPKSEILDHLRRYYG